MSPRRSDSSVCCLALAATFVLTSSAASADVLVGADYGGADLAPADGDYLQGTFTNVGTFSVPAGVTVFIDPGNTLTIVADRAEVHGTIDGAGAGAGGGLGGVAGPGLSGGNPGGGGGGAIGSLDADPSGGGGAGHGGAGGSGAANTGAPGAGGPAYDTADPPTFDQGSGGGGAGGMTGPYSGVGGDGGHGGAGISITADIGVYGPTSLITADGDDGSTGTADPSQGSSSGGGGSGGGILLTSDYLLVDGELSASGGDGGDRLAGAGSPATSAAGGGGGAGGRIKMLGLLSLCNFSATNVAGGLGGLSDDDVVAAAQGGAAGTTSTAGSSATCCGNGVVEGGESCDDGNNTSGDCCSETCDAETAGNPCPSDGSVCTADVCNASGECTHDAAPIDTGCLASPASKLQVRASATPGKSKLSWGWSKGAEFDQAALGDPLATTTYTLCLYDYTDGEPFVRSSLGVPASSVYWTSKDPKGLQYKNKAAAPDGVTRMSLKTGLAGKTKVKLAAGGTSFTAPASTPTTYFDQDPKVTVQLVSSLGTCWTADYAPADTTDSDTDSFKAKVKE